jgi:hypothetical protein
MLWDDILIHQDIAQAADNGLQLEITIERTRQHTSALRLHDMSVCGRRAWRAEVSKRKLSTIQNSMRGLQVASLVTGEVGRAWS